MRNEIYPLSHGQGPSPYFCIFPFSQTPQHQEYFRLFNCPHYVRSKAPAIQFPSNAGALLTLNPNDHILKKHQQQAAKLVQLLPQENPFTLQIKRVLIDHCSPDMPSLDFVAEKLCTTPRTIQRKLKAEGASFYHLSLFIRMVMAKHYLRESDFSIAEIAFLVGYSEASAFVRAFKKAQGRTPASYRSGR